MSLKWTRLTIIAVACLCLLAPTVSTAQINKELVDKAPKEIGPPMPHIDPDNPDVIQLRDDPARGRRVLPGAKKPNR